MDRYEATHIKRMLVHAGYYVDVIQPVATVDEYHLSIEGMYRREHVVRSLAEAIVFADGTLKDAQALMRNTEALLLALQRDADEQR